jgi:hypothetical protein
MTSSARGATRPTRAEEQTDAHCVTTPPSWRWRIKQDQMRCQEAVGGQRRHLAATVKPCRVQ